MAKSQKPFFLHGGIEETFLSTQNMLKLHNHEAMINMACILKATQAKVGRYITHAMPSFFHSSEVGSKCNSSYTNS